LRPRPFVNGRRLVHRTHGAKRMDSVGIVVDDLAGTIDFFRELGLELERRATIEGEWAGRVTGLADQRVEIAMMRTPDGHGRLELSRFLMPLAMSEWLKEHAWKAKPAGRTERHQNTSSRNQFNDLPL
jgi:catechol 2,3-dioxygenase-like lactoylglutathione lyase family enzyme